MNNYPAILNAFDPIGLDEMDDVKLLDRVDVKFIFHRNQLSTILELANRDYKALTVHESRCCRYETRYFDTPDLKMYIMHHNGKLNRHKVRFRDYKDSGSCYFEIKFKSNKGRTIKDRIKVKDHFYTIEGESEFLLERKTHFHAENLIEAIEVDYNRITLVQRNFSERLTIDEGLSYRYKEQQCSFPGLVIAEVKQDRAGRSSFIGIMQKMNIHPMSLSKYCFGIASLNDEIKKNQFKYKLLNVKKLCNDNI